jgi:hypothetical protein
MAPFFHSGSLEPSGSPLGPRGVYIKARIRPPTDRRDSCLLYIYIDKVHTCGSYGNTGTECGSDVTILILYFL